MHSWESRPAPSSPCTHGLRVPSSFDSTWGLVAVYGSLVMLTAGGSHAPFRRGLRRDLLGGIRYRIDSPVMSAKMPSCLTVDDAGFLSDAADLASALSTTVARVTPPFHGCALLASRTTPLALFSRSCRPSRVDSSCRYAPSTLMPSRHLAAPMYDRSR